MQSLFARALGEGRMKPALEQEVEYLSTQAQRALALAQRLHQGDFSGAVALEAEQLVPGQGILRSFYSASAAKRQLALESVLETVWNFIKEICKKIAEAIRKLVGWITGNKAKIEKDEKKIDKLEKTVQKLNPVAAELGALFKEWSESEEGKKSGAVQKLTNAPGYVTQLIKNEGFGKIGPALVTATKDGIEFLDKQLVGDLKEFLHYVEEQLRSPKKLENIPAFADRMSKYELHVALPGGGSKPVEEAVAEAERLRAEAHKLPTKAVPIEELLHFVFEDLQKLKPLRDIISDVWKESAPKLEAAGELVDELAEKLGQIKPTEGELNEETTQKAKFAQAAVVKAFGHYTAINKLFVEAGAWYEWIKTVLSLVEEELGAFLKGIEKKAGVDKDSREAKVYAKLVEAFGE